MRRGLFALILGFLLAFIYVGQANSARPAKFPVTVGERGALACKAEYLLSRKRVVSPRRGFSVHTLKGRHVRKTGCYFGKDDARATRNAYWRLGWPLYYVKGRAGGQYGPMLHAVLQGKAKRPLKYRVAAGARKNRATLFGSTTLSAKQRILISNARYLISHRSLVLYSQARRMEIVRLHLRFPPLHRLIYEDCSSSTTGLYWRAGLPDPNGLGYNGFGFTGTQAAHGRVVWRPGQSLSRLKPGDLIFYGWGGYPYTHVTMYLGHGRVFSHGGSTGPFDLPVLYRSDARSAHRYFG